jgi:hypothetical protein
MSNTLLTIDMIADRALAVAHEKAAFLGTVYRDYDSEFGKQGGKVGDTIRIRKPNQYVRRQGSRIMDVQDQGEANTTLTVATQDGVDMKFNSAELALSIDKFSERYIEPAVSVMVSGIEGDVLAAMTKAVYNTVGTAGTVPGASSDITVLGNARAKLNQYLAPKDSNRVVQMDSITMASIVNGTKSLFQDSTQIKEAFREGFISRNAMADWYENERTLVLANGSDVTGTTDSTGLGTAASDGSYSTIDMHTTIAVATQVVGEVFTIANVYACHPETKAAYSHLQDFTITAIGASLTTISPPIYLSGAKKNVVKSDGTALATTDFNSATLTFRGSASTSYRYNLMYHRDAFAFVTADLPLMADAASCVRKQFDGLSLRVWQGSDIRNDEKLMRLDILYGYAALKPEWACRIISS